MFTRKAARESLTFTIIGILVIFISISSFSEGTNRLQTIGFYIGLLGGHLSVLAHHSKATSDAIRKFYRLCTIIFFPLTGAIIIWIIQIFLKLSFGWILEPRFGTEYFLGGLLMWLFSFALIAKIRPE